MLLLGVVHTLKLAPPLGIIIRIPITAGKVPFVPFTLRAIKYDMLISSKGKGRGRKNQNKFRRTEVSVTLGY